jgi:L-threonylcarbamoyladenylate synthase
LRLYKESDEGIEAAAAAIKGGELAIIPTETVYGLAAKALDPDAVAKIFTAKGRPAENPLIVHIADPGDLEQVAASVPDGARRLISAYWPGPLTLVLTKTPLVPFRVTAGLDTVAVRCPAQPVARRVIELAGVPVAAPSANRFMEVSPTRVEHLDPELMEQAAVVLDSGPCEVGLESTIVDFTVNPPAILRPGGISRDQLERVLGAKLQITSEHRKAPGQYARHYSPKAKVRLVQSADPDAAALVFNKHGSRHFEMSSDPEQYGRDLYDALIQLDKSGADEIQIEIPPRTVEWEAVRDRIEKAAG